MSNRSIRDRELLLKIDSIIEDLNPTYQHILAARILNRLNKQGLYTDTPDTIKDFIQYAKDKVGDLIE